MFWYRSFDEDNPPRQTEHSPMVLDSRITLFPTVMNVNVNPCEAVRCRALPCAVRPPIGYPSATETAVEITNTRSFWKHVPELQSRLSRNDGGIAFQARFPRAATMSERNTRNFKSSEKVKIITMGLQAERTVRREPNIRCVWALLAGNQNRPAPTRARKTEGGV
ncbi:hypothetical protein B0H19DRAFT_1073573 [Mycena capillaripes]|nr:hypothetical protein B0H19DRAFT_1073573 [Mycena capillaripes]